MAQAYGFNTNVLMRRQVSFDTPASGNYIRLPILRHSLGDAQGFEDQSYGPEGREPKDPGRSLATHGGDIEVPLCLTHMGWILYGLFGAPVTSGSGDYTHVFKSGASSLPFHTIEVGHPETGRFLQHIGVMFNSTSFKLDKKGGYGSVSIGCLGQTEIKRTSSAGGSPVEEVLDRIHQWTGAISRDGSPFANVTECDLNFSNGLVANNDIINGEPYPASIDLGQSSLKGNLTARFVDDAVYDLAVSGEPFALELAWAVSATRAFILKAPAVRLEKAGIPMEGPGGIRARFSLRGEWAASDDAMFIATLKNARANYDH
jgi:hypothetical protein